MSTLAWNILLVIWNYVRDIQHGYIPGWTLGEILGGDAASIQAAHVLHGSARTQNEYERALRELVDRGLVEEMPNLGERWRLVVREEQQG